MIDGLKKVLAVSVGLNLLLIVTLLYLFLHEKHPTPYFELKPPGKNEQAVPLASSHNNAEMVRQMRLFPVEQLIEDLADTEWVEDGFKQRDLALASLVTFHHFDLPRALLGLPQPTEQRSIVYGTLKNGAPALITLYPSLREEQFEAIIQFAKREKWPLTSRGLFFAIRQKQAVQQEPDPTLIDAFYLSPEFLSIEMLFNRSERPVEKQELLRLLTEGDWKLVATFAEQQRAVQDLSSARRQRFLLDYIEHKSRTAAYLLLKTDPDFASHKLDDPHVIELLKLLPHKTPEAEQFALAQLTSPRSNLVWKLAARRLYAYAGELLPETFQHDAAIERFVSKDKRPKPQPKKGPVVLPLTKPVKTAAREKPRLYIVREGDSLWKIAKQFKVEIGVIKKANKLQSDMLKPGTSLMIPQPAAG